MNVSISQTHRVVNKQDADGKLTELQEHAANLVQFKRFSATIPKCMSMGTEVLYRRSLATVIAIQDNPSRIHRTF